MIGALFILAWGTLFLFIGANTASKKKRGSTAPKVTPNKAHNKAASYRQNIQEQIQKIKKHDLCRAATVKSYKVGVAGMEDRENDWLARQLREEAKLKQRILSE